MFRVIVVLALVLVALPAHAGKTPPKIQFRVHVQATGGGDDQVQTVYLPPNNEPIQIRSLPEVTEHDIVGVQPQANGTLILFNHSGDINLSAATAQNQGRVMVVFINGYIIYAPIIDEQITNGQLLIPHPFSPDVLKLLQDVAQHNVTNAAKM